MEAETQKLMIGQEDQLTWLQPALYMTS